MVINQEINIKYEIKGSEKYGVTSDGRIFNQQTQREIRCIVIGTTKGYCINGKFKSLKQLRKLLIKPQKIEIPF